MSNISKTAAALEAIREDIRELRDRLSAPSQRERLRAAAQADAESPDPMPHALYEDQQRGPESIQDQIQRFVRMELSAQAESHELESFAEADDFSEDDFDSLPTSIFEVNEAEMDMDPEMPRIEDADDSRAIDSGAEPIPAEPPPVDTEGNPAEPPS